MSLSCTDRARQGRRPSRVGVPRAVPGRGWWQWSAPIVPVLAIATRRVVLRSPSARLVRAASVAVGDALLRPSGSTSSRPAVPIRRRRRVRSRRRSRRLRQSGRLLASSADGDRAVAAVLTDLQDFWSDQLAAAGGPGFTPTARRLRLDGFRAPRPGRRCASPTRRRSPATRSTARRVTASSSIPRHWCRCCSAPTAARGWPRRSPTSSGTRCRRRSGPTPADRRRDPDRYPSILIEAQADCDAGAFLAWAAAGPRRAGAPAAGIAGPGGRAAARLPRPGNGVADRPDRARAGPGPARLRADRISGTGGGLPRDDDRRPRR